LGILATEMPFQEIVNNLQNLVDYPHALFTGNSTGQILVLGLGSWWLSRIATSKEGRLAYFRLTPVPGLGKTIALAVLLTIAVQPLIQLLGWLNMQLPLPASWIELDKMQMKMIERLLSGDMPLWIMLFHVAVVPAVCEELMFRGVILRNFERELPPWVAIVLTGTLFGLYHLRFSQALPLILLGILITWLVWRTGSLWVVVAVHFVNNAGSVIFASFYPEIAFDPSFTESPPPVYLVAAGFIFAPAVFYLLIKHLNASTERSQTG
jgi:membrane protease YdiL (CAAX protease family)